MRAHENGRPFFQIKKVLKIPVLAQPVSLGRKVAVDDVALLVLEAPRGDNECIALPYPGSLLHGSLDPAHTADTVDALDTDVVCPQHQFSKGELFIIPFLG